MELPDLGSLQAILDDCDLSMQVHSGAHGHSYVVWLYAPEDPETLTIGEGESLSAAFAAAIEEWDDEDGSSIPPPPVGQA